jgi:hypothetical protein
MFERKELDKLINKELKTLAETEKPFNSDYEAFAFIQKEIEKVSDSVEDADAAKERLWAMIKADEPAALAWIEMYEKAIKAAQSMLATCVLIEKAVLIHGKIE